MRVLHVIPGIAPRYGGPSKAIFAMVRALQQQGIDVLIATTDADGPGRLPVPLGRVTEYQGVPTIFFSRQWSEAFKFSYPLARWLRRHVADFDVVHIHAVFSHSSLAAAAACRKAGVPYVLRPLGSLDPWALGQKRLFKRLLWHLGVKQMIRGAAALHFTTDEERRLAEETTPLCRGKGVVIPHGVDEALLNASVSPNPEKAAEDRPYVLFLGWLHPKKGLELLLDAFLEATDQSGLGLEGWELLIGGDGEPSYRRSLERRVVGQNGAGRVRFLGWVEGEEKAALLRGAALLVLPSYQENFGLSAVEAMACGVPVLVSEHVNLAPEIREAGAGWVTPLERKALAQTLAEALQNQEERRRRGALGQALVRSRYIWPAVACRLMELYKNVRWEPSLH